jgi:Rab3 GTPase-activating protein catalytic subunit
VEEDAEVLLQLGTDAQGAKMRARMMSASLLSDMESFKVPLHKCHTVTLTRNTLKKETTWKI